MSPKIFMLAACLAGTLALADAGDNSNVGHKVTIKYPSDLLSHGEKGSTSFTLDFVAHHISDLRSMYCESETLRKRISSGVCVIDYARLSPFHKEINVQTNSTLHDVLENSGMWELKGWQGNGQPNIRVVSKRAIIADDGSAQFLQTKIFPGDFIVVLPID